MSCSRLAPSESRTAISSARAGGARQQQVGDVGARDEQHERGHAEEEQQRHADMARAAAIDPGSYRIRMLLARAWARAGRCDRAIPLARDARELFPNHPAPQQLLRACGARPRR